ncbi:putative transcriptional regulatory protein [Candidatus Clavichlamydia salmonicola]|uniref:YebC/PmpR family DNA-binding transcriptional regulator n=1 Tax=Candidatus Clavichlamydia salmonicola TaxID=469812 RepID=UPI001890B668|nr:YebC/PmpR family DNA-binding transcriptional regulator [Candidatus Clavichlamydia salmonicola]MBF5051017.1 putative transcriptional regulatory protein [Candidatus Clavichlamydia salmonicola]
MAGHSKWANIKYRKERADTKKGKIFSIIGKELISAVKNGGGPDPKANARLRFVIQKAKALNVPNENIERNIKKAVGSTETYDDVCYEIYGHGGVGIIVEAMTDNKNRTATEMRIAINKRGGTIAQPGSVMFNFMRKGICYIEASIVAEDLLVELALEAGAEDIQNADEQFLVITDATMLYEVKEQLEGQGIICDNAEISYMPEHFIECTEEVQNSNMALVEWLEGIEDVSEVYHNMAG